MSVNTSDPLIGRLIDGRYQVRSRIARGGMATVYLATDLRLERRVAVKIMHGHLADDHQFKQRFIQEARSAARLAHPNVVNVFDQGQDDDSAYLVMEYLPGITLRDLLHDYGALTPEQTIDIASAVLSGLAAAHRAGIVHRDLKPENVLLADDGRIKIGDFGLARAASANTATGAALLGTIAYLSPELVTRGIADTRSDIYAVGIMMFEMLTGEQPYKGEQPMQIAYQHANDSVPAPSSVKAGVPAELDELVLWATARDPEDRPADARVLLDQVKDTEGELRTALPTNSPRTAAQRTLVLPVARSSSAEAETQVLGAPRAAALVPATADTAPNPPLSDATSALATVTRKRRGRGWVIALVVLLLVALAGGAGWYFGWGPGANIGVPGVADSTPDAATSTLQAAGLRVSPTTRSEPSVDIAAGKVVGTDPKEGSSVAKDTVVTLLVSSGPKLFPLDKLTGQSESVAKTLVKSHWTLGDTSRRFDPSAAEGTVIAALGTVDGKTGQSLDGVTQYGEKQPIALVVSAGQLPDVAGKSVADATRELNEHKLQVAGEQQHQTTMDQPEGAVIGIVDGDYSKPISPNDTVTLIVSDGPPPVDVPNVVGMTWDKAKKTLTDAGLKVDYNHKGAADVLPGMFKVVSTDPASGQVKYGSTIKVDLDFIG